MQLCVTCMSNHGQYGKKNPRCKQPKEIIFTFAGFSKARKDIYLDAMNNTRLRRNFSKPNVIKTYALFYFPTTTSDVKTCCRGKKLCF